MNRFHTDRVRSTDVMRIRVFLDHWEFARSWLVVWSELTDRKITRELERTAQSRAKDVRWDRLPEAILDSLEQIDYIADADKELRSIDVYASLSPRNQNQEKDLREWLQNYLDELPA